MSVILGVMFQRESAVLTNCRAYSTEQSSVTKMLSSEDKRNEYLLNFKLSPCKIMLEDLGRKATCKFNRKNGFETKRTLTKESTRQRKPLKHVCLAEDTAIDEGNESDDYDNFENFLYSEWKDRKRKQQADTKRRRHLLQSPVANDVERKMNFNSGGNEEKSVVDLPSYLTRLSVANTSKNSDLSMFRTDNLPHPICQKDHAYHIPVVEGSNHDSGNICVTNASSHPGQFNITPSTKANENGNANWKSSCIFDKKSIDVEGSNSKLSTKLERSQRKSTLFYVQQDFNSSIRDENCERIRSVKSIQRHTRMQDRERTGKRECYKLSEKSRDHRTLRLRECIVSDMAGPCITTSESLPIQRGVPNMPFTRDAEEVPNMPFTRDAEEVPNMPFTRDAEEVPNMPFTRDAEDVPMRCNTHLEKKFEAAQKAVSSTNLANVPTSEDLVMGSDQSSTLGTDCESDISLVSCKRVDKVPEDFKSILRECKVVLTDVRKLPIFEMVMTTRERNSCEGGRLNARSELLRKYNIKECVVKLKHLAHQDDYRHTPSKRPVRPPIRYEEKYPIHRRKLGSGKRNKARRSKKKETNASHEKSIQRTTRQTLRTSKVHDSKERKPTKYGISYVLEQLEKYERKQKERKIFISNSQENSLDKINRIFCRERSFWNGIS